jgi:hypothetical protein
MICIYGGHSFHPLKEMGFLPATEMNILKLDPTASLANATPGCAGVFPMVFLLWVTTFNPILRNFGVTFFPFYL